MLVWSAQSDRPSPAQVDVVFVSILFGALGGFTVKLLTGSGRDQSSLAVARAEVT